MKKVMIIIVLATMFAVAGCSKSKTCNCTTTQNIPYVGPSTTNTTVNINEGNCSDLNTTSTTTVEGVTVTTVMECTEK